MSIYANGIKNKPESMSVSGKATGISVGADIVTSNDDNKMVIIKKGCLCEKCKNHNYNTY